MALPPNYYERLELERDATPQEVSKAFRKLALKHHPDKHANSEEAQLAFKHIAEAYEVLSSAKLRALYDQYGEAGLKDGVPDGQGGLVGGSYRFSGDAQRIFETFFGSASPFADIFGELKDPTSSTGDASAPEFYGQLTSLAKPVVPQQPRAISRNLAVSLAQLYTGDSLTVPHARKRLNADGVTTRLETTELNIQIEPGFASGTKIVFPQMGDEGPAVTPADVVYTLKESASAAASASASASAAGEKGPTAYRRAGNDLVYTARISLTDALCGCLLALETLDGRTLSIGVTEVVGPTTVKKVVGEGMPIPHRKGEKGDLLIEFDIRFPEKLTPKQRAAVKAVKMA